MNLQFNIGHILTTFLAILTFPLSAEAQPTKTVTASRPYNVLFISIDDLRPELNCYGAKHMVSPNIDRLAAEGMIMNRAYVQQALCGPTRASLLTGLRPDSTRMYDLTTDFRDRVPNAVTLPQYFKNKGYYTASFSKIFHVNDRQSWSVPEWVPTKPAYALQESLDNFITSNGRRYGPLYEIADLPDNAYPDGETAEHVVKVLNEVKDKPFFLAVGFLRPHLPFNAPRKYWDLYDPAKIVLPDTLLPKNIPALAQMGVGTGELRQYAGVPKSWPFPPDLARKYTHGYYASVSYMDAQVGKVLDELRRLGLDKNTVVVLWGDHGWKLGEYGLFGKRDNMETDLRAPLIISTPEMRAGGNKKPSIKPGLISNAMIEFIDIYPTIAEAAGLPKPAGIQGESFYRLFSKPDQDFKEVVYSQNIRPGGLMGYTMRTKRYRYTEYHKTGVKEPLAYELYDEEKDPGELNNVAGDKRYAQVMKKFKDQGAVKK